MLTIDFETRSKADLKKVGAWRYSIDESTDVMCLAYRLGNGETKLWTPFFSDFNDGTCPDDLRELIEDGELLFEAHNSFFEYCIWNNVLVRKYGFPPVVLSRLRDSAAKAAALALPRDLGTLGGALGLKVEKDMEGRRLMLKMSKPRRATKDDKSEWHEDPKDLVRLFKYCVRDVDTEHAASEEMKDLSEDELNLFLFDQKINARGVYIDKPAAEKILGFLDKYAAKLIEELIEVTGGAITTPNQHAKIKAYLESRGVIVENTQKDTIEQLLKDDFLEDDVRRLLEIRLALGKASIKKLEAMLRCLDPSDNRVRGTLLFHGASTGRWSGKLIQPQNFPRGSLKDVDQAFDDLMSMSYEEFIAKYPDLMDAASSMLRGFICAPPGKKIVAADFSSIESRALFWLAEAIAGLEAYRTHGLIYEDMAASIYNTRLEAIKSGSFERQLGKQAILGCGYGMGDKKFRETCEGYGMEVGKDMAKLTVAAFRAKYPEVVQFWYALEAAAVKAVKNPGQVYKANKIAYKYTKSFLWCRLPSGRLLAYYKPRLKMKETPWGELKAQLSYMGINSQTRKWERQHSYGGKLCENVTQAVARDFMAHAMLNVEKAGYPITMTVHDEIVAEPDEDFGSVEEFEKLMVDPPEWGLDCPIAAEGWTGKRFRK